MLAEWPDTFRRKGVRWRYRKPGRTASDSNGNLMNGKITADPDHRGGRRPPALQWRLYNLVQLAFQRQEQLLPQHTTSCLYRFQFSNERQVGAAYSPDQGP